MDSDIDRPQQGQFKGKTVTEKKVNAAPGSGEKADTESNSTLADRNISYPDDDDEVRNSIDSGFESDLDADVPDTRSASATLEALEAMAEEVLGPGEDFHTALFLSGQGETQQKQVEALCKQLTERFFNGSEKSLTDLLDTIKNRDSQTPGHPVRHSFLLRCAILQASEENGTGMPSWQAFTHAIPPEAEGDGFWPWLEQWGSWIPEAQGAAAKYMEHSWIKALELAKKHPEQQVIAYKGGFGAGKTSHGKATFGENFSGSIAPDSAKKIVRRALPVSHAAAHIQGSDMAFKLFDGLIKYPMGTVIYDSSLSSARDVKALIEKSSKAAKPLKVVDITRDDKARALAVLARTIDGEDPRVPLVFIESGAERDRKQRPACMNAILDSPGIDIKDAKSGKIKKLAHTYEFHCGNARGADRQLLCTLKSGQPPKWNNKLEPAEIQHRLTSQGLKFNTRAGRFESLYPEEQWQETLRNDLKQPVKSLLKALSDGEANIREKSFGQRTLPLTGTPDPATPANLYTCLVPEIRRVISAEAFIKSFNPLSFEEMSDLISLFAESHQSGKSVSYMELPAVMAIELHRAFRKTPTVWNQGS